MFFHSIIRGLDFLEPLDFLDPLDSLELLEPLEPLNLLELLVPLAGQGLLPIHNNLSDVLGFSKCACYAIHVFCGYRLKCLVIEQLMVSAMTLALCYGRQPEGIGSTVFVVTLL